MKVILIFALAVQAHAATGTVKEAPPPIPAAVPAGTIVGDFDEDAETVYERLRRLMLDSRRDNYLTDMDQAIARRDPGAAQKAMDALDKEFPELRKEEPDAFSYHQGGIDFWKGDMAKAYEDFDGTLRRLERKYKKGIPPGPYATRNAYFMSTVYFSRGSTELQMGRYSDAVSDIEKAIKLCPKRKAYMFANECWAFLLLGKYPEAAGAYDSALEIDRKFTIAAERSSGFCRRFPAGEAKPKVCALAE